MKTQANTFSYLLANRVIRALDETWGKTDYVQQNINRAISIFDVELPNIDYRIYHSAGNIKNEISLPIL